MNIENFPEDLQSKLTEIKNQYLTKSREQQRQESEKHSQILEDLNNKSFELQKDILILVGGIFGSSIALATGGNPNAIFIGGEISLLLSVVSGIIILYSHLSQKEWTFAFFSKLSA